MGNFFFPDLCLWNFWQLMETLSQTVSTDTFDNWNPSLTSWGCPVTTKRGDFLTQPTRLAVAVFGHQQSSTCITRLILQCQQILATSHLLIPNNPNPHPTRTLLKKMCSAKKCRSLMEKNGFLWWETSIYLSTATKPSGQRCPSAERNWGYSVNPYHLLPAFPKPKTGPVFLEERFFLVKKTSSSTRKKSDGWPSGRQWLANWGGDHNTENQQFHGEEHHDQCEHLRIGELLAYSNGRTLLKKKWCITKSHGPRETAWL